MFNGVGRWQIDSATLPFVSGDNKIPLPRFFKRAFVVLLASGLALNAYLLWSQGHEIAKGYADFTIFYSAANVIRSGDATELYDEEVQYRAQLATSPGLSSRGVALPYNHPPFEALLFVPLASLTYLIAYIVWAALNLTMLFAGVWLLTQGTDRGGPISTTKIFLLSSVFFPAFTALLKGQDLILLLLIFSASYALLKRDADLLAGAVLGLGVFRPELCLPMAVLVSYARGRRFAGGFIVSAAAMTLFSAAVTGWQGLASYLEYVLRMEHVLGHGSIVPADMPNLRGLISLFMPHNREALTAAVILSVLVLTYALRSVRAREDLESVISIAVLSALLISYHALVHDLTLLLIPLIVIYKQHAGSPGRLFQRQEWWAFAAPMILFSCTPLLAWLWLGIRQFCLVTPVLGIWLWGISRNRSLAAKMHSLRAGQA